MYYKLENGSLMKSKRGVSCQLNSQQHGYFTNNDGYRLTTFKGVRGISTGRVNGPQPSMCDCRARFNLTDDLELHVVEFYQ